MGTPTEVCQLDCSLAVQEVFRLEISMDNLLLVKILKCLHNLPRVVRCLLLVESSIWRLLEFLEKFAADCILKNQVNLLLVPEEAIEPANVVVSQVRLNFDLSSQLCLHFVLDQLLFYKNFQGHDKFRSLLSCKVYMPKLASSQRFTDFEIVNAPFLWLENFRLDSLWDCCVCSQCSQVR